MNSDSDDVPQCTTEAIKVKHSPEIRPEEWARFIELKPFSRAWKRIGFNDDDRRILHICIMTKPDAPVIPGTGGLRKLRFVGKNWKGGKRGGARVCYAYYSKWSVVFLAAVYLKTEKDDLSQKEKNEIKALLMDLESALEKGEINV